MKSTLNLVFVLSVACMVESSLEDFSIVAEITDPSVPSVQCEGQKCIYWLLVSEPGFLRVLGDLGRTNKSIFKLRPRSNIV